jgi:hypothetical protein
MIGKCTGESVSFDVDIYSDEAKTQVVAGNSDAHITTYQNRTFLTLKNDTYFNDVDYSVTCGIKTGSFNGSNAVGNAVEIIGGFS